MSHVNEKQNYRHINKSLKKSTNAKHICSLVNQVNLLTCWFYQFMIGCIPIRIKSDSKNWTDVESIDPVGITTVATLLLINMIVK